VPRHTGAVSPRGDVSCRPFDDMERLIIALRTDYGCFAIIVAFVVIMISAIVFANILTPPASNPLL
jgi:hypothetical protein